MRYVGMILIDEYARIWESWIALTFKADQPSNQNAKAGSPAQAHDVAFKPKLIWV
jgi:hypothetical protein